MLKDSHLNMKAHSDISFDKVDNGDQGRSIHIGFMIRPHCTLEALPNELINQIINEYDASFNIPAFLSRRDSKTLLSLRLSVYQ
jgi:hypothetical protein